MRLISVRLAGMVLDCEWLGVSRCAHPLLFLVAIPPLSHMKQLENRNQVTTITSHCNQNAAIVTQWAAREMQDMDDARARTSMQLHAEQCRQRQQLQELADQVQQLQQQRSSSRSHSNNRVSRWQWRPNGDRYTPQ